MTLVSKAHYPFFIQTNGKITQEISGKPKLVQEYAILNIKNNDGQERFILK